MSNTKNGLIVAGVVAGVVAMYYIGKWGFNSLKKNKTVKAKILVDGEPTTVELDKDVVVPVEQEQEQPATEAPAVVEEQPVVVEAEPVVEELVVEAQPVAPEAVEPVVEPVVDQVVETVVEQAAAVVEEELVVEAQSAEPEVVAEEPTESEHQQVVEEALVGMGAVEKPAEEQPEAVTQKEPTVTKKDSKEETRKVKQWFDSLYNKSGNRAKWDPEWVVDNDYQDALFTPVPAGTKKFHSTSNRGTKLIWTRELGGKEIDTEYPVILFWDKSIGKLCVSFFHNVAKEPRCFEFDTFASVEKFLTPLQPK